MQDLYLQLQNLKRTDKYCLIFIVSLFFMPVNKNFSHRPASKFHKYKQRNA